MHDFALMRVKILLMAMATASATVGKVNSVKLNVAWRDHIGENALLQRELRVALRSPRVWLLIAIYVSLLGAVVLTQFPDEQALSLATDSSSAITAGERGHDLMKNFVFAQLFLVWLLVPALACGALAQERERQTLQTLLLTPLSPLQVVWGKAAGVLAIATVLLLGTLPLTSLCFLLGGVSPGEIAGYYAILLTQALFFTGIGLYCAARWHNTLRATFAAYAMSIAGVAFLILLAIPGIVASAWWAIWALSAALFAILRPLFSYERWRRARRPGRLVLMVALFVGVYFIGRELASIGGFWWLVLCTVFIAPYGYQVSSLLLQAAAQEVAKRPDSPRPRREFKADIQKSWQQAMQPAAITPIATPVTYRVDEHGHTISTVSKAKEPAANPQKVTETYAESAFLRDNRNAIFARDMRHGLGGKASTMFRYGYVVVIATELLLIVYLSLNGDISPLASQTQFANLASAQLVLVLMACAWLGSRAIAPEREGQTLSQLLSLPLWPRQIIGAKIASVLFFSSYAALLGLPLTLAMPMLDLIDWPPALWFLAIEIAFGALAASWGVFSSLQVENVRRALTLSLGGVAFLLLGTALIRSVLETAIPRFGAANAIGNSPLITSWLKSVLFVVNALSPLELFNRVVRPIEPMYNGMVQIGTSYQQVDQAIMQNIIRINYLTVAASLLLVIVLATLLFMWTARGFRQLARES